MTEPAPRTQLPPCPNTEGPQHPTGKDDLPPVSAIKGDADQQPVHWSVIASLFANVVVSPWNLLIGGLLIQKLTLKDTLVALLLGYTVIGMIAILYGELGVRRRRATSELLEPVFGRRGNRIFFSAVLAIGQIGWFAVIVRIGGGSLDALLPALGYNASTLLYSLAMLVFASLSLFRFAIVKALMTVSVLGLTGMLLVERFGSGVTLAAPAVSSESLLWGMAIVVASLASFITILPDFTSRLRTKQELRRAVVYGICGPGVIFAGLGTLLFAGRHDLQIAPLFGGLGLLSLGHLFNVVANTDASIALYTPAFRLSYMFDCSFKRGLLSAFALGIILSFVDPTRNMEVWITTLGALFPPIIGIALARYSLVFYGLRDRAERFKTNWKGVSIVAFCSSLVLVMNISLLTWTTGILAFILYILMTGVTIQISIGKTPRVLKR